MKKAKRDSTPVSWQLFNPVLFTVPFPWKFSSILPGLLNSTFLEWNQERKRLKKKKYSFCPQILSLRYVNNLIQLLDLLSCPLGILSKVFVNGKEFTQ